MPTREPVSENLLNLVKDYFNKYTIKDLRENLCVSTITCFIIHLYELSIISYTLKYSYGTATFKYVKQNLPRKETANELVIFRDNLTHNFYNIKDFKFELNNFIINFTSDNFKEIFKTLNYSEKEAMEIYNILNNYCK